MRVVEPAVISRDDVLAARTTIAGKLHRTPTLSSRTLGDGVFLKAELLQKTGSFKPRGVLNKLAALSAEEKRRGVIAISAGNHAQAVAWGAAAEGIDALVVMWADASAQKVAATRGYGAAVDLEAPGPAEAFERLAELQAETGRTLVHPFDDPVVQAGAGTVGLEVEEDVDGLDTIVVPVGGGGLVAGIAAAVAPAVRVVAVEPELSPALHEALKAGKSVPVQPRSIADGLGAPFAGEHALAVCRAHDVRSVLVSEQEIAEAMRFVYARAKLACEPAGAAAVAAVRAGKIEGERVCCVVSGGNVAAQTAAAILGA
ncbi:MAG TPA: pyridoxal-phosphate dependent enzyme [Gaiellaceae bacterium]|nr:pyridoxal-phosphate dependent enzyme [Gaiellaceae bacterium]